MVFGRKGSEDVLFQSTEEYFLPYIKYAEMAYLKNPYGILDWKKIHVLAVTYCEKVVDNADELSSRFRQLRV